MVEGAKSDEKRGKIEEGEGWGFYEGMYGYIKKGSGEDGEFMLKEFDLKSDVKRVDAKGVNEGFVGGL
ncbi:hypothetical protein [Bacillus mycoides]|uniref:hypothetical protein n=1 Tax=Bacillus mycoides TaxID=1405 RepID=UPI0011AB21A8|nr:hypothetical protein [Bacillus mycoides]